MNELNSFWLHKLIHLVATPFNWGKWNLGWDNGVLRLTVIWIHQEDIHFGHKN